MARTTYGDLTFDATISANHSLLSEITDHPVEEGADPSDHIRPKSQTISLDIVFTSLPLSAADTEGRGEAPDTPKRGVAGQQLEKLESLQGQALTLTMPWRTMTNMAIASISNPVTAMDGFRVKVDFKQIRFVSSSTVQFQKAPTSVPKKPTDKPDQGKKAPTPDPPTAERRGLLDTWTDAWGITTKGGGVDLTAGR